MSEPYLIRRRGKIIVCFGVPPVRNSIHASVRIADDGLVCCCKARPCQSRIGNGPAKAASFRPGVAASNNTPRPGSSYRGFSEPSGIDGWARGTCSSGRSPHREESRRSDDCETTPLGMSSHQGDIRGTVQSAAHISFRYLAVTSTMLADLIGLQHANHDERDRMQCGNPRVRISRACWWVAYLCCSGGGSDASMAA
ncbi:hypothetical protein FA10DRAFT_109554 [Acaromyces ingoldii]|uniref:Uncharacterized protein n=1 Tax=Acaromyces ingoldii TaxID=215250 RepID=A0A316YRA0_9BASI|nr:hypothetical protein FA10DRAFT_109554 [Acaromyces ingoldii]PWN90305.1 hypothetical protein FA10DRAFT_109554 [Acaromyces ingoldii]